MRVTIRGAVVEVGTFEGRNGKEPLPYCTLQQQGRNGRGGQYPQLTGPVCASLKVGEQVTLEGTVMSRAKGGFWVADLERVVDQQPLPVGGARPVAGVAAR